MFNFIIKKKKSQQQNTKQNSVQKNQEGNV